MEETFDPATVIQLVDEALNQEVPSTCVPVTLFDGRLLEKLAEVLPRHVGPQATRAVIRELRVELLDGQKVELPRLQRAIAKCTRCPGLSSPSPTWGNLQDPDLLIVTENPYGIDPHAIWKLIEDVGIVRHRVALTSATRCRGTVGPDDIARCSEFLVTEVEVLHPELVLTLGAVATQVFLGNTTKISEARGRLWWIGPWAVLPTYSLAYAARGGRADADLRVDLAHAKRYLDG